MSGFSFSISASFHNLYPESIISPVSVHTIYLVGMPSSGKTTLGQALAESMQRPFVDLDAAIVEVEGRSIANIFRDAGEPYFRELEARTLREVTEKGEGLVIATGGGAPIFHDNMSYMKERGVTVFLHVSAEELGRRLLASQISDRPLVQALAEDDFLEALQEKQKKRLPFYRQAHVQVYDDDLSLAKLQEALREAGYLRN